MDSRRLLSFFCLVSAIFISPLQVFGEDQPSLIGVSYDSSTPFSIALENLQSQINYTFQKIGLLRRAMTHASFSEENNKAFAVLGESVIKTSVALQSLSKNVDMTPKDLTDGINDASKVDGSCKADGTRLGLQKIVRVSHKTNVTAPSVMCGAFRAMFGAISIDAASSDEAGRVYLKVHGRIGEAAAM